MDNLPYKSAPNLEDSLRQLILNNQQNPIHHAVNPSTINNDTYSHQRPSQGLPAPQAYQQGSQGFSQVPRSPQIPRSSQIDQNISQTGIVHSVEQRNSSRQHPVSPVRQSHNQRMFPLRERSGSSGMPMPYARGNYQRGAPSHQIQAPPSMDDFPPLGASSHTLRPPPTQNTSPRSQPPIARGHEPIRGRGLSFSRQSFHGRPQASYAFYHAEQARYLDELWSSMSALVTPPESEGVMKRKLLLKLENICRDIIPGARLIPFGSLVTGFATASSDIDCIFSLDPETSDDVDKPPFPDIHEMPFVLEEAFKQAGFEVLLLSRTRVPIIKLVAKPTDDIPVELQCDIGFNNDLAIHNTQLLLRYAQCDDRVTPMVLFVKWWAKKRHINSPYRGTLSSYGYVLLILHYLINKADPPVLPNLQMIPMPSNVLQDEIYAQNLETHCNIWFFKELEKLKKSVNHQTVGELLRGFFEYYAYSFGWGHDVVSIRTDGGILTKEQKDWVAAKTRPGNANGNGEGETWEVKDRYLLAIEDPFEITHNVGRTCTANGVYRIRDELRRAMKLIKSRDKGQSLQDYLFLEAPPEKPFVRKEDMPKKDPPAENCLPANSMSPALPIPAAQPTAPIIQTMVPQGPHMVQLAPLPQAQAMPTDENTPQGMGHQS